MTDLGHIVEYVSTSDKSFDDAIKRACVEVCKMRKGVRGIDVINMNARVSGGKISEYRVNLKISCEA